MTPKRHFPEEGHGGYDVPLRDPKRRPIFKTLIGDLTRGLSLNEAVWEPFLRRVVRDEVERAVFSILNSRPPVPQAGSSGGSGLQLHFVNKLPGTIFTGSRIESEESTQVQIILTDASSQTIVNSGPLSSIKIEVVALNGEFGSDDQEDWTEKEFNDSIVREREGKRPLVTGELTLTLREGVGYVGNIVFTDNSSWIRCRKFRLGARVVQKVTGEVRIREARSEPFVVKDHRGELYKKHHPPQLHDEIWRLEKIAKDGAFHKKLASYGIETVKEFLQMYTRDYSLLSNILNGISKRTWNVIVQHAMNYVNDNKFYAYHRVEHDVSIHFNSICKVVGATFSGRFCTPEELTPSQKALVENLKKEAYKNENALVLVDDFSIAGLPRPLASLQAAPFNDQSLDLQHDFQLMQEDQSVIQLGLSQPSTQSSYPCGAESSHQLVISAPQNNHPFHAFPQTHRNSFSMEDFITHFNGEPNWSPGSFQGQMVPSNHFATENLFQLQTPSFSPITTTWEQGPSFLFSANNEAEHGLFPPVPGFVHISKDRKRKASWCKLRAAFKCWLSVKLAARKMARPLYLGY
ncbi:Calmodulin-binding protein [Trema orientale]|uniref:Calmodulin-binding protein n=1 Tax=Trema orientale TaxID=63057 RepID=A0A2P5EVG4_TREOI|nr:Calmodulin-binding protein [Trema orientale]